MKIGVAYDEAFSFIIQLVCALGGKGAELVYFSPLNDSVIPDVDGLVFGGGFPEMFLFQLSSNESMKESIRQANAQGMPIYAGMVALCIFVKAFMTLKALYIKTVGIELLIVCMQQKLRGVKRRTKNAW